MNDEERNRLAELHGERFRAMGYGPGAVGWGDRPSQQLRFEELCRQDDFSGASVCDIGCGFGDLSEMLHARSGGVRYTGVDLCPEFIGEARRRFPGDAFEVRDILGEPFPERSFDFVLCSGALSLKIADHEAHVRAMLAAMYAMSRRAVIANFLSDRVDFRLDKDFHLSPVRAMELGLALSRFVSVSHDYPLFEFTLVIRRIPRAAGHPGGHRAFRAMEGER
jgi:SAM-dependent methyltransferase